MAPIQGAIGKLGILFERCEDKVPHFLEVWMRLTSGCFHARSVDFRQGGGGKYENMIGQTGTGPIWCT